MEEIKHSAIKIGDLVKSTSHPYSRDIVCTVDRIYTRHTDSQESTYARLAYEYKGVNRLCNVWIETCTKDISSTRNKTLVDLFSWW